MTELDPEEPVTFLCLFTGEPCPANCRARRAAMEAVRGKINTPEKLKEALRMQRNLMGIAINQAGRAGLDIGVPCVSPIPKNS